MSRCEDKEKEMGSGAGGAMKSTGMTGPPLLTGQLKCKINTLDGIEEL